MTDGDSFTLIQTKLHVPHVSSELAHRPRLIDQASLMGILSVLYELGYHLISVEHETST
jgi:hypothetical protein